MMVARPLLYQVKQEHRGARIAHRRRAVPETEEVPQEDDGLVAPDEVPVHRSGARPGLRG